MCVEFSLSRVRPVAGDNSHTTLRTITVQYRFRRYRARVASDEMMGLKDSITDIGEMQIEPSVNDEPRRRDRHDIIAEILETARGGVIITHMMCRAKLSYTQISEYLPVLLEKGYLETQTIVRHRKTKTVLKTSEQGEEFIRIFRILEV